METSFKGNEKKHIPSKEVDTEHDVGLKSNEADVKGEMELRKGTQKKNDRGMKSPDKPNKVKK